MKPDSAEYQRILGTLCGQMISSSSLAGLKYGKCALDSVDKAIELDPKSSMAYVSHGVGNYYLPQALGGGIDLAIKDFRKAIDLNPKNADAWLWLGDRAAHDQSGRLRRKRPLSERWKSIRTAFGPSSSSKKRPVPKYLPDGNHRGSSTV